MYIYRSHRYQREHVKCIEIASMTALLESDLVTKWRHCDWHAFAADVALLVDSDVVRCRMWARTCSIARFVSGEYRASGHWSSSYLRCFCRELYNIYRAIIRTSHVYRSRDMMMLMRCCALHSTTLMCHDRAISPLVAVQWHFLQLKLCFSLTAITLDWRCFLPALTHSRPVQLRCVQKPFLLLPCNWINWLHTSWACLW